MVDWIQAYVLRASRVLEHRLASFLGTAVILLLMGDSIRRGLPDNEGGSAIAPPGRIIRASVSATVEVKGIVR
jgi:hypothetical protein